VTLFGGKGSTVDGQTYNRTDAEGEVLQYC
jgi:hypothetical protein